MSKALLVRDAWSADHYDKEVKTTMTNLAEILTLCKDTIFAVSFKKKVDVKDVESSLTGTNLKDDKQVKQLSKSIVEGVDCEIVGRLAGIETTLGRSLIIDLNADPKNNFRQIDHRSINWIIFKNVKYSQGKKTGDEEYPLKPGQGDKWNQSKLQVGNWFSATSYYKVEKIIDKDNVQVSEKRDEGTKLTMSRDILETEMNSGLVYDKEEKISRTQVVE